MYFETKTVNYFVRDNNMFLIFSRLVSGVKTRASNVVSSRLRQATVTNSNIYTHTHKPRS